MDGDVTMVMWPVNETTQPDMDAEWKCHVQERLATNKASSSFLPNFSAVIVDQYLFIFVKLEEDNIYFFGRKGLEDEKGILEFPLRTFSDSLKLKRDRVIFVVKLV